MKCITYLIPFALIVHQAKAQPYWSAVGMGPTGIGTSEVRSLFNDPVSDRLLAGGIFFKMANQEDTVWAFGQAAWNGHRWDSIAARISGGSDEFAPETYWFLRYQGSLYACGDYAFSTPNGFNMGFARLNEQAMQWEALECNNTLPSGLGLLVPKEPQDTLYATGYDGVLCGLFPPTCVYSYDGSSFQRWAPFDLIPDTPNRVVSSIFKFNGMTYMAGAFADPLGQGTINLIRWNGTAWEHVPGWNNIPTTITDYSIHDNLLYLAGDFLEVNAGPGNLVASFDGTSWNNLGGGLGCVNCWSANSVNALQWFHGELWACGMFDRAMDLQAHSFAKWDGQRWCVPPGDFYHTGMGLAKLYDMAVWRDSLFVCGLFNLLDGAPAYQVAKWIGGATVAECSTVGLDEAHKQDPQLEVVPLMEPGLWRIQLPDLGVWTLDVFNVTGRQVGQWQANGVMVMDLSARSPGMYLLRATGSTGALRSTKLVRP